MKLPILNGINPHVVPVNQLHPSVGSPIRVLSGLPGYINVLDALNSWRLVKELRKHTGLPSVSAFKHLNPTGTAVGYPLDERMEQMYETSTIAQSLLACAFLRSRSMDREVNQEDFIAFSDPLDFHTAKLLLEEDPKGIIAPAYEPRALDLLKAHKESSFLIVEMDSSFEPEPPDKQTIFGLTIEPELPALSSESYSDSFLHLNVPQDINPGKKVDLLISLITLKYSHSHSVALVYNGQTIGLGAGQQSIGISFKMAMEKAKNWMMLQHPRVLSMSIPMHMNKSQRELLKSDYIQRKFTSEDCYSWMKAFQGVCMASDRPLNPHSQLQEASRLGVRYHIPSLTLTPAKSSYSDFCEELGILCLPNM
ncbi:MAG: hypothetical protein AAF694_20115 [Bacteroidota bacterium]